jgi:hypothetical protein
MARALRLMSGMTDFPTLVDSPHDGTARQALQSVSLLSDTLELSAASDLADRLDRIQTLTEQLAQSRTDLDEHLLADRIRLEIRAAKRALELIRPAV